MIGLAGRTLDRYTLGQRVGKGGMADVYLGYDPHFQRSVAIKIFKQDNDGMLRRFMREAKLMAALHHPHLMPIYDTGESELDGVTRYYIVMPLIDGGTLGMRIRHSVLSPGEASSYLFDIASALDYLHRHGIIHRDIKSTNVLLSTDDLCYLSDLGVARVLDDVTSLTSTGNVLGTVDYIAPELFVGAGKADARSDIYSLGVLLFEMITGQRPFASENQVALASMHVNQPPPSPRSLVPSISLQVEQVLLKALEKDPELRFPTASALADAFYSATKSRYSSGTLRSQVDVQAGEQIASSSARSTMSTQESYSSRKRVRPFIVISLLLVLFVLIAVPGVYLFYNPGSTRKALASVSVTVQPHVIITPTATATKQSATPAPVHNITPTPAHTPTPSPSPTEPPTRLPESSPTVAPTPSPAPTVAVPQVAPTVNLIQDPDYEMQTSRQLGPPWSTVGQAGADINTNNTAYSGKNNAWIYSASDNQLSEVGQHVNVTPNTTYTLSVYILTSDRINPGQTSFGVRGASGAVLQEIHYGNSINNYTQLSFTFNSGMDSLVYVHVSSAGAANTWVRVDNWSMHT